ncbi:MAG: tetratricopeptide repeat protein [Cyanobacteria bacterium P01_G01_bin.39]
MIYTSLISLGLLIKKPQEKTFSLDNISSAQDTENSSDYIFYAEGELNEKSGKDSDNRYYNFYSFDAQKDEQATINLISDDFDVYFNLVDGDGNSILSDNDSGQGTNAKAIFTVPKTGKYTITITSIQANKSGKYVLSFSHTIPEDLALIEENKLLLEAKRLNQEVLELLDTDRFSEAIPLAKEALAIRQKYLGDNNIYTANSQNNLAEIYRLQGKYAEAEPLYIQALETTKQEYGIDSPLVAESYNNLALLYYDQSKYEDAALLYIKALTNTRQQPEVNYLELADYSNHLGLTYLAQGKYNEAGPLLREALAIRKDKLDIEDKRTVDSINNLAGLLIAQGKYSEAEVNYIDALTITRKQQGNNNLDTAISLNNLAALYVNQGKYTKAEPLYREALEIKSSIAGENDLEYATSQNNLAQLYYYLGRYSEAESLYQRSLKINIDQLGAEHPDTIISVNNLAAVFEKQGSYEEAKVRYQKVLAFRKKRLGDNHLATATAMNNLAGLYRLQSNYKDALSLYQKALAIREEQLGDNHPDTATSINNLASLYRLQGNYDQALPLYQKSLAIREEQLSNNHPDLGVSLNNLATIYWTRGDAEQAIKLLKRGLEIEENNLSNNLIAGSEQQKLDYVDTISGTSNSIIAWNLELESPNAEITNLALKTVLQRKGRILDFLHSSIQTLYQQTEDSSIKLLLDELIVLKTQYSQLFFNPDKLKSDSNNPKKSLKNLETEIEELEGKLSILTSQFNQSSTDFSLSKIQKLIPNNSVLVELIKYTPVNYQANISNRFGSARYAAYILQSQNDAVVIDLGEAEIIERATSKFRSNLQNQYSGEKQLKDTGRELDKLLMKPIRQLLGDQTNILISPDGVLNLIPFEALVDENNQYLVENFNFTYLTSGRDLLRIATENRLTFQQPGTIMGDPLYNSEGQSVSQTRTFDVSQQIFDRLDETAIEAEAIFAEFPDANKPLIRSFATENALKQVTQPQFLHLATHGFFINKKENKDASIQENPLLRSGLVFAGVKKGKSAGDDGILTALEATTLDLRGTQLVVLSACDTGVGEVSTGEGIYGLRRAFVLAGSESQVISLWKVDDTATRELMVNYYRRLKNNEGRSLALHEVQREMLKSKDYQHPYYWAGFISSGDWTEINP